MTPIEKHVLKTVIDNVAEIEDKILYEKDSRSHPEDEVMISISAKSLDIIYDRCLQAKALLKLMEES